MRCIAATLSLGLALAAPESPWTLTGPSPPSALLTFRLGLALDASAAASLADIFQGVSTPSHPLWGQHLTREQADAVVRPAPAQQARVLDHLAASCAATSALSAGGDWVEVRASAACGEALFGVPSLQYVHAGTGSALHRCAGAPSVPPALAADIAVVAPCARLPRASTLAASRSAAATTPATIRAQYGLGAYEGKGVGRVQVAGFLDEFAEDRDLQQFFAAYYPPGKGRTFAVVGPNGAVSGVEAALDVQYVMSIGANVNTTFWYTDAGSAPNPYDNEPYLSWLLNVTALPDAALPHTVSVSYADNEDTIDPAYAAAVEVLLQKMGARGVSMLHASGDGGVSGTQSASCKVFKPTWPASSPSITSVGSTDTSFAKASGFSGGGFSNVYRPASYQAGATQGYLRSGSKGIPPARYYNSSGRGIPDVSAVGENFMIVSGGNTMGVDGTSCSTPTFAGIVALLNDARVAAGKRGLGFLNNLLYAHPEVFTDIAAGSNPGCGTEGFPAIKGWDPVTGLGTPVWPALYQLAMALP